MNNKNRINNELTWNTIAKSFDKTRNKPWDICIKFIESLSTNDIVIDIGCGNGRHSFPCSEYVKNVISVDISNEFLKIIAVKNNNKINLIHSNFRFLPFKNKSFNAALFIASLHNMNHRRNRIDSLIELKRILKKNGKALISVWSRSQDKYKKYFENKLNNNKNNEELGDIIIYWKKDDLNFPRFYHLYSKNEFLKDINSSGLKLVKNYDVKLSSKKFIDNYFALVEKN